MRRRTNENISNVRGEQQKSREDTSFELILEASASAQFIDIFGFNTSIPKV